MAEGWGSELPRKASTTTRRPQLRCVGDGDDGGGLMMIDEG